MEKAVMNIQSVVGCAWLNTTEPHRASRETLHLYFCAEIIVLSVIPSPVVTLEGWVSLQVLGYLIKSGALHSTNGRIGDEKFIFMFVD